jgi:hypothetical protein
MSARLTKEVIDGQGGRLTAGVVGQGGGLEFTRTWRVLLANASDTWDAITEIGVGIGDVHPQSNFAVCTSIETKPDGDSRLAWLVTATYSPTANSALENGSNDSDEPDEGAKSPELRYANWSTSTSTYETPSWWWIPRWGDDDGQEKPAHTPAGEMVDGLTIVQPIVNITIEQFIIGDPTLYSQYVGMVNSNTRKIGSLEIFERSLLFRGVSFKAHAEQFGKRKWRGWLGTFEFSYKYNWNNAIKAKLGWDIGLPLSGNKIKNTGLGRADVDKQALHLELTAAGAVKGWPNPTLVDAGQIKHANIMIPDLGGTVTQRPSAMPVPLNEDGTPRSPTASPPVLVKRYQMYKAFDMTVLNLRLRQTGP